MRFRSVGERPRFETQHFWRTNGCWMSWPDPDCVADARGGVRWVLPDKARYW